VQVLWVEPCLREEAILVGELFQKTLQMDRKSIFTSDVVHPDEMVDSLVGLQLGEEVGGYAMVLPTYVPVQVLGVLRHKLLQLLDQFFILHTELGCRHNRRQVACVFA